MFQAIFKDETMRFQDMGILKKFYEDELGAPIQIPLPQTADEDPLNLSQMSTAFLLYAFGMLCGIISFAIELTCRKTIRKKSKGDNNAASETKKDRAWL